MAGIDGFAGVFDPVNPGVVRPFTLIFSDNLAPFDAVASIVSSGVSVSANSKAADPNAAALASGVAAVIGNDVVQTLGLPAPNGFQPGVLYIFYATILTNLGSRLYGYAHIPCAVVV